MRNCVKNSLAAMAVIFGSAAAPKAAEAELILEFSGSGDFETLTNNLNRPNPNNLGWLGKKFSLSGKYNLSTPQEQTGVYDAAYDVSVSIKDTENNPEFYANSSAKRVTVSPNQVVENISKASLALLSGNFPEALRFFQAVFEDPGHFVYRTLDEFVDSLQRGELDKKFVIVFDDSSNAIGDFDEFNFSITDTNAVGTPEPDALYLALIVFMLFAIKERKNIASNAHSFFEKILPAGPAPR